jgi:hypothetical protein
VGAVDKSIPYQEVLVKKKEVMDANFLDKILTASSGSSEYCSIHE